MKKNRDFDWLSESHVNTCLDFFSFVLLSILAFAATGFNRKAVGPLMS